MFNLCNDVQVNSKSIAQEEGSTNKEDKKVNNKVSLSTQEIFTQEGEQKVLSLYSKREKRVKRKSPDSQLEVFSSAKRLASSEVKEKSAHNGVNFLPVHVTLPSFQSGVDHSFAEQCIAEFTRLKAQYAPLFQTDFIQPATFTFPPMPDVGMDKILVVSSKKCKYLGTSGVVYCHAVCGRGKTENGEFFLVLAHISLCDPSIVLKKMTEKLRKLGCPASEHAFYIFGGALPASKEEDNSCLDNQQEFLSLSDKYPIKEVKFNMLTYKEQENVESYAIVFGEKGIYFKKGQLFNPVKGYENAGKNLI
jgi:hypothetical protein